MLLYHVMFVILDLVLVFGMNSSLDGFFIQNDLNESFKVLDTPQAFRNDSLFRAFPHAAFVCNFFDVLFMNFINFD